MLMDKIVLGLTIAGIGILVVFSVLLILIIFITVMSKVLESVKKGSQKHIDVKQDKSNDDKNPMNDTRLVAIITAAVACMLDEEGEKQVTAPFVIRKIKEIRR